MTSVADGGGKITTARCPVIGSEKVARYLAGAFAKFAAGVQISLAEVNGEPAILGWVAGNLRGLLVFGITDGRIQAMHVVANPDKLAFAAKQAAGLSHSGGLPVLNG